MKPLTRNFHAKQFPKRCYSSILLLKSQEVVLLLAPLLGIETFFALFNWKSMNLKKSQLKTSQQNKTHNTTRYITKGSSQKTHTCLQNEPSLHPFTTQNIPRICGAQNSLKRSEHRGGWKTWRHIGLGYVGLARERNKWFTEFEAAGRCNVFFVKKMVISLVDFLKVSVGCHSLQVIHHQLRSCLGELRYYEHVTLHKCFLHQPTVNQLNGRISQPLLTKKYVTLRWVCLIPPFAPTCPGGCKHRAFLQQGWKRFDQRPIVFPQRCRYTIERIIRIDQHLEKGAMGTGEKTNPETSTKKT